MPSFPSSKIDKVAFDQVGRSMLRSPFIDSFSIKSVLFGQSEYENKLT